ncbi:unnamed protein product [Prunus armeniaca]|uniref:Cysteine proteinase inhibitor n=1 Tax=Prunus armeniaca TaxID=36596 RepID=A0A6J5XH27_PRUAR|nr:unnamed protein product [Prunus armeniaca]
MTTAIRSVVGKLGSKYSSCCHSKGRTVANMVRVGDFQIRSSVVSNYNIDRDVLFSISKPPPSYGYSSRHPFLFGNHHKKAPPVLHLEYFKWPGGLAGNHRVAPYSMDNPNTIALAIFAVREYNKEKNAKLRLVRVLRAWYKCSGASISYFFKMEAVDKGVVKVYQALVFVRSRETVLRLFGLLNVDNGSLLKLIFKRPTTPCEGPYECIDGNSSYTFFFMIYGTFKCTDWHECFIVISTAQRYMKMKIPRKTSRNCLEEETLSTLLHVSPLR